MNSSRSSDIAILILAAGSSSRMGQPKQLLRWRSKTLLEHSIDEAEQVFNTVMVVLGAYKDQIRRTIHNRKIDILENSDWQLGMGTSIAKGVREIEKNNEKTAVLVMLSDQPLLGHEHLNLLLNEYEKGTKPIVCTKYGEKLGVPAIFGRSLFLDLKLLNNDFGARHIIKKHGQSVAFVKPEQKVTDIDTFDEYNELYKMYGQ